MKIRFFVLLGVAMLVFSACNKDNSQGVDSNGNKAYVAFSVAMPSNPASRADAANVNDANHKDNYVGTVAEQAINAVRVVLFKTDGSVKYAFNLAATTDGSSPVSGVDVVGTPTVSNFVSKGREIEIANYELAVFINPTAAIVTATAEGSGTKIATMRAVETTPAALTSAGILMSNADGFTRVLEAGFSANINASMAESSPIAVRVDRAVAKLFVGIGTALVPPANGATLGTDIAWLPNVTNKKTFWVRELAPIVGGVTMETATTPRYDRYAKDPNFAAGVKDLSVADLKKEFDYATNADNGKFKAIGYADANGVYVLENTMEAAGQYTQVTTTAIVRLNYAPKDIALNESWFNYNGMVFSVAELKASLQQAVEEAISGDMTTEIAGCPAGFKSNILGFYQDLAEIPDFTSIASYDGALIDAKMATGAFQIKWTGSYLNYYHLGVNYYDVLIRHFDDTQESTNMAYGRYGIVRNNIYKMDLETVLGPGRPTIVPEPEPGDEPGPGPIPGPDDRPEAFISARVSVMPWYVRVQSVNLQ